MRPCTPVRSLGKGVGFMAKMAKPLQFGAAFLTTTLLFAVGCASADELASDTALWRRPALEDAAILFQTPGGDLNRASDGAEAASRECREGSPCRRHESIVSAGFAVGYATSKNAIAWAGSPPAPNYCWYFTERGTLYGFWEVCP
jgi:hypothetical protein